MNPHYHKRKAQAGDASGVEAYWGLLQNLSAEKKRALAKRLLDAAKNDASPLLETSIGDVWEGESAEDLVEAIYSARTFTASNEREPL